MNAQKLRPKRNLPSNNNFLLEFENSEALIAGIQNLYSKRKNRTGSLYKIDNQYVLITRLYGGEFTEMGEFCLKKSRSSVEKDFIKEHGKLICEADAIKKIGKAFIAP